MSVNHTLTSKALALAGGSDHLAADSNLSSILALTSAGHLFIFPPTQSLSLAGEGAGMTGHRAVGIQHGVV